MDIQGVLNNVAGGVTGAEAQFNNVFKQPTQVMNYLPDMSEFIGPTYDYSGELKAPNELGIRMGDGSSEGIFRAAAGVDYYAGALGYGKSVGLAKNERKMKKQEPLGLNYFLKTGGTCSNGANMYEYVSTIPTGIPGPLGDKLAKEMKGIRLQGLAPGIVNDAADALNPAPFFNAVIGSGFAKCKQVTLPVGDYKGKLKSKREGKPWIDSKKEKIIKEKNKPHEKHWVFDRWISADDYDKEAKVYPKKNKKGRIIEDFQSSIQDPQLVAGVLFATLFLGIVAFTTTRK
jgi:hypothetical protein